jgi:4-hydroxy-2-oxoheptanedioate aldolase
MRFNTAKQRMLNGEPAIGVGVGLSSPLSAELLAMVGFDYVLVDGQHGLCDDRAAMLAFRSTFLASSVPMARVQQNDFYAIGRLLDRGALGIVVPLVNSVEQAEAAAHAMRYPPRGGRSIGNLGALFYDRDYSDWIDDEVFLAVQIESAQAVELAEDILAVPGVDGCWVGPADLAASMGVDPETPEGRQARDAAILRVADACRSTGKIPGIAASGPEDAARWIEEGFLFVTANFASSMLINGGRETLRHLGRQPS